MRSYQRFFEFSFASRVFATAICVLLFGVTGWTTTVIKMDLPALVERSDNIVQGMVEEVFARWDPQRKIIFTYTSLRIDEAIKGRAVQRILVRQLGGRIGGMNMLVEGMPKLTRREHVIVFLTTNIAGTYDIVGLSQGKYEIVNDFAITETSNVDLFDRKTGQTVHGGTVNREPLDSFKSRIRSLIR